MTEQAQHVARPEQDRALAMPPVDELLDLPMLSPDRLSDGGGTASYFYGPLAGLAPIPNQAQ